MKKQQGHLLWEGKKVVREGWLEKMSGTRKGWKKRYFILTERLLAMFDSDKQKVVDQQQQQQQKLPLRYGRRPPPPSHNVQICDCVCVSLCFLTPSRPL